MHLPYFFTQGLFLAFILSGVLFPAALQSQDIAIGEWRTHLAYFNGQKVAVAPSAVYCASENGLFALNTSDNSLQTIGKLDGLSDTGIADLAYHMPTQTLVIAYQNGNIDLLREDEIINVRSLLNANRPDKRIFQIQLDGNFAYMATAFGGLALQLDKIGIGDVYEGLGGFASQGKAIALSDTHLYLLTNAGVFRVSRAANINRQDFANWEQLANIPLNTTHIAMHNNMLYYATPADGLFRYENNQGMPIEGLANTSINFLRSSESTLSIGTSNGLYRYQNENLSLINDPLLLHANDAVTSLGSTWLADGQAGLVRLEAGAASNFIPTGTLTREAFRIFNAGRKIVVVSGGFNEGNLAAYGRSTGFYVFEKGAWRNFTAQENLIGATEIPAVTDISAIAYNAIQQKIYIGSYGGGMLIWDLTSDAITQNTEGPLSITGLSSDSKGVVWATATDDGLYQYSENAWKLSKAVSSAIDLTIDDFDAKWIRLAGGNMLLLNEGQERTLRHEERLGNLRGARVHATAIGQSGSVLVGTDNGITEFFDSYFVLSGEDGSTVFGEEGLPLHQGETVTAIAIDGGNQKWVGTENGGVWLYDNANRLLSNFTTENSPLLSNSIQGIAIEPNTGEVFFATSQGLVSFRGNASEGGNTHQQVKVFPNPVRPDYQGLVAISGLVTNATVRITDTAGHVVWKGSAAGGTVVWDRKRFDGQNAKTGIYLVFSSNADGQETFVSKIAVVE